MPYTIYTDRNEEFMCEVAVKNASLKNAFARMIVESSELTLMFEGKLENGKCIVPIRRLKGVLNENSKGKMYLEVIVEDTYFKPWQDNFIVEEHTSVKVKVNEQRKSTKPIVEVRTMQTPSLPAKEIAIICEKVGITRKTLLKKGKDFKEVIKEYFKASPEFKKNGKRYIREAIMLIK
jgi:hypothetical protein